MTDEIYQDQYGRLCDKDGNLLRLTEIDVQFPSKEDAYTHVPDNYSPQMDEYTDYTKVAQAQEIQSRRKEKSILANTNGKIPIDYSRIQPRQGGKNRLAGSLHREVLKEANYQPTSEMVMVPFVDLPNPSDPDRPENIVEGKNGQIDPEIYAVPPGYVWKRGEVNGYVDRDAHYVQKMTATRELPLKYGVTYTSKRTEDENNEDWFPQTDSMAAAPVLPAVDARCYRAGNDVKYRRSTFLVKENGIHRRGAYMNIRFTPDVVTPSPYYFITINDTLNSNKESQAELDTTRRLFVVQPNVDNIINAEQVENFTFHSSEGITDYDFLVEAY